MLNEYFSEREGIREPIENTYQINEYTCKYLYDICSQYFKNMANFGEECPDNRRKCGIDFSMLMNTLKFEIPDFKINKFGEIILEETITYTILDFIEFIYKNIVVIQQEIPHNFFGHTDYVYSTISDLIQNKFVEDINRGFKYTGLLYLMNYNGIIERVINNNLVVEDITKKLENVNNKDLKKLIETAIKYHKSKKQEDWKIATEKIWDAFENMKTYYLTNKKGSLKIIFDTISPNEENFRELINNEFTTLTKIGNDYQIRHFEKDKIEIKDLKHYDYFFNRCLSIINLTLPYLKQVG